MADTLQATPDLPDLPTITQAEFLELFGRILPQHYLAPLQEPGPGYELLQAYATVGERVSRAVARVANGNYLATAPSASRSAGVVRFTRATSIWGGFTLLPGTVVGTATGYEYVTKAPVTFSPTELGPKDVLVEATVAGWLYDQPGPVTLASGAVIPGNVDRIVRPALPSGGNYDPTLQVAQVSAITGGCPGMLDGLGADRGLPRFSGESDVDYRQRLRQVPDTVTPAALRRVIAQQLGEPLAKAGLTYWIFEGWDLRVQTAWDVPPNSWFEQAEDNVPCTPYSGNIFVYDYEPITVPEYSEVYGGTWTNRWWATNDARHSLIIGVPNVADLYPVYSGLYQTLQQIKPAGLKLFFLVR